MKNPKHAARHKKGLKFPKLDYRVFLLILFFIALLSGMSLKYFLPKSLVAAKSSPEADAKRIDDLCHENLDNDRCFADAFYTLTQKYDSKYATDTLIKIQKIDPQHTTGCHFTAHKISQAETEKDPKNWEKIIQKVSPSMCTGGFLHGVLEAHLAMDPDFTINEKTITHICTDIINGPENRFGERSCSHNLGHLMLIQEDGHISQAVAKCSLLKNSSFRYECLSGSFMETLTAENLLAHGLIKTRPRWNTDFAKNTEKLCSQYSGLAAQACWKEISYVYFAISDSDPQGLYTLCQRAPIQTMRDECYIYGAGNMVTGSNFKPENLHILCHQFSEANPLFTRCMDQTIGSLITSTADNLNKTMTICSETYADFKSGCYGRIVYFLSLNKAPRQDLDAPCSQIPEKVRTQLCRV